MIIIVMTVLTGTHSNDFFWRLMDVNYIHVVLLLVVVVRILLLLLL